MNRPTCPRCSGDIQHIPAGVVHPENVRCMQCGWYCERGATVVTARLQTICTGCGRTGQSIQSKDGLCGRCIWRKRKGLNLETPTMLRGRTL